MEQYKQNFEENKVDGYLILELEEEDVIEELKITKKLHRKKIMKAIEILKEYQEQIKSQQ